MGGGGGRVQETAQQRAQAQHAMDLMQDYKQRWLPVQQNLAQHIQQMGAPGSVARRAAAGRASTDTAIQFDKAQGAVEKSLTNAGAAPGSAKFNLGVTGVGQDKAASTGLGAVMADQHVDDAYTAGLSAIMATGRGERIQVGNALADQAQASGRQAAADAEATLRTRSGDAELAGQFAGYGLQSALGSKPNVQQPAQLGGDWGPK
jgi:hypothetical protein